MAAMTWTPVLPEATLVGALFTQLRHTQPQRQRPLDAGSGQLANFETLATIIRAICGFSLQTPSARMTKSLGSKT
jgi:hypothetical protein